MDSSLDSRCVKLEKVNIQASELLTAFRGAEKDLNVDIDELVSNLQSIVGERQLLIDALISDDSFVEQAYLERQLELTYRLKVKATKTIANLKSLMQVGKQGQRQVNVYKSVDANR